MDKMLGYIHVTYYVTLDEEDAKAIDEGSISPDDIDWTYYIDNATEKELDCVDVY